MDKRLLYINLLSLRTSIKSYEDNQETIESVLADIITPQSIPLDVLITDLHELNPRKNLKWRTQDQTCNLLTSILNLMAEKFSKILLIVLLASVSILLQDHFTIRNFILDIFMSQLTSIARRIRKVI